MRSLTTLATLMAALCVAALNAQGTGAPAPASAASKGLIVGRVVDAVWNTPIPGVIVALAGAPLPGSIRVLTDAQGRFLFRNVPKGSFTLRATIGAGVEGAGFIWAGGVGPQVGPYLNGGYGQRRPGGLLQTLDLADGEQVGDAVIKLWQGGSIDGHVFDEAGEPLVDVVVAAPRVSPDGRLLNGPTVRTDDRGAYHFGTLVPGDYVVVVTQLQAAMPAGTNEHARGLAEQSPERKTGEHWSAKLQRGDCGRQFGGRHRSLAKYQRAAPGAEGRCAADLPDDLRAFGDIAGGGDAGDDRRRRGAHGR